MDAVTPNTAETPEPPLRLSVRSGLVELLRMAAPTVATMTSYTAMQFVDGIMVSRITPIDPVHVAAQGNGGVWAFTPLAFVMGSISVVNTYVAQHLGAGHPRKAPPYVWNALWLAVVAAVLLVPYGLAMPWLFGLPALQHEPLLQQLESRYAQILIFGAVLTMGSRAMSQFFFGMHRPAVVLVAALSGNCVNLLVNLVLIYGNDTIGFPALGVTGAAIGTLIGTAVEFSIPLSIFLSRRYNTEFGTRAGWRPSLPHLRDIVRIGWPASLMFGNEMVCWSIFMTGLAGHFGTDHAAASWIGLRYMHLSFMPAIGIGVAATALVGRAIGAKRYDIAAQRAWLSVGLAAGYCSLCAACFVLFREDLVRLFLAEETNAAATESIVSLGKKILIIAAIFQLFDGPGVALIGVLRGAGDTTVPGVITVLLGWLCIIGCGAAFVMWAPGLGSIGPWIGAGTYIVLLGLLLMWRFAGGAWKRMDVLKHAAGA